MTIGAGLIKGWRAADVLLGIGSGLLFLDCALCLAFGHEDIGKTGVILALIGLGFSIWSGGIAAFSLLELEDAA